jgi:NAD(P)-dependent dehydrogenase (short-subunit alcohol dehydrogenase family)
MSKALAKTGVKVVALDLIRESAQNVVDEIQSSGGEAFAVQCDVLDKASIEQAAETILDKFGRVDILINGAGGNKKEATGCCPVGLQFECPGDFATLPGIWSNHGRTRGRCDS